MSRYQGKSKAEPPNPFLAYLIPKAYRLQTGAKLTALTGGKIKGKKRHSVVETLENLRAVIVHTANIHDTKAGIWVARVATSKLYTKSRGFCAGAGYRGTFEEDVEKELGVRADIVKRDENENWSVLPKRWIVERTFAWLNNFRGLSKDYEITKSSSECMIKIAFSKILLNRL